MLLILLWLLLLWQQPQQLRGMLLPSVLRHSWSLQILNPVWRQLPALRQSQWIQVQRGGWSRLSAH